MKAEDDVAKAPQIIIYPPPGPSTLNFHSQSPTSVAADLTGISPGLQSAISVRFAVFVREQKFPAEIEIDSDDARSWHWVALAAPSKGNPLLKSEDGRPVHTNGRVWNEQVVAATLRLVPDSSHQAAPDFQRVRSEETAEGPSHIKTALWNGREPYIKLGRLATLPSHRGMGLGKLLVESAMAWAGRHREILYRPKATDTIGGIEEEPRGQWNGLVLVHAQKSVEGFWESAGFVKDLELGVWREEGVEHVGMWRRARMGQ